MCFQIVTEQLVEKQPSPKTSNTSDSSAAADEWDHPKYQSEDFKMYEWKVTPCTNTDAHDTDTCPYAHPGEKSVRRDVRVYKYSPEACPATQQKNGKCPRGMDCPLAHTVFERWLHPQRFRTQMCTNGPDCPRKSTCFFAHSEEQLRRVVPDIVGGSGSSGGTLCLAPSVERVSSLSSSSSSASGSSTISGSSFMSSPHLLQQGSIASCFSISSHSSTPPSSSIDAAAAAASPKGANSRNSRPSNSSSLAGLRSPAPAPAAIHVLNKLVSRSGAAARSYAPAFGSSGMGSNISSSSGMASTSPVGGVRGSKAAPGRAMASALAAQLKQQLEGQQELMRQQQQHLQEQQQLQQLQALMQQLPMPGGDGFGSPNSAQHMQLLLEQEISNNIQQAALAAAAAEAANQRLNALRYAMHTPGMLSAAAAGGYAPAAVPGSAGFGSSTSPVSPGGGMFSGPAVCEPLTLGLDWNMHHHQQQQQNLPMHFSAANNSTLQGLMGPSTSSPVLHPLAGWGAAYGHSNSHSGSHSNNTPAGLGFAGNDASNNEQALLAMLLSQMQGSAAAAAPGVVSGLHGEGPVCGASPHSQTTNPCASQAQAAASTLLAAAAAASMMPAAAGVPGAVLPSYTDASMVAPLAMQPQGGCHSFFMP